MSVLQIILSNIKIIWILRWYFFTYTWFVCREYLRLFQSCKSIDEEEIIQEAVPRKANSTILSKKGFSLLSSQKKRRISLAERCSYWIHFCWWMFRREEGEFDESLLSNLRLVAFCWGSLAVNKTKDCTRLNEIFHSRTLTRQCAIHASRL